MKLILLIFCVFLVSLCQKRIAIIGCGAGGASAAHFLKDYSITVFE
jgi:predicted NAD/FAD-binding protein